MRWEPPSACDTCDACDTQSCKQLSQNQLWDQRLRRQCDTDATRLDVHATRRDRDRGLSERLERTSAPSFWADGVCRPARLTASPVAEWADLSARARYAGDRNAGTRRLESCEAFAATGRRSGTTVRRPASGLNQRRSDNGFADACGNGRARQRTTSSARLSSAALLNVNSGSLSSESSSREERSLGGAGNTSAARGDCCRATRLYAASVLRKIAELRKPALGRSR
jgi:hypothetical protein